MTELEDQIQHCEGLKIPFWQGVYLQSVKSNEKDCNSVQELFARFKILPKYWNLQQLLENRVEDATKPAFLVNKDLLNAVTPFLATIGTKLEEVDTSTTEHKKNNKREILASEFLKISKSARLLFFPSDAVFKLQSILTALNGRSDRTKWSKRTFDNVLYSAIFQRYLIDNFATLGDQSIKEYLPAQVQHTVDPDLVVFKEDSPFLICKYCENEHESNNKDLIKLIETMQQVITTRYERFKVVTSYIYGVLCCGSKLTLLYMERDCDTRDFPCYFIANSPNDLHSITLEAKNIADIFKMNIAIFNGGSDQRVRKPRPGRETAGTTTPAKIDNSKVLSVHQTNKKTKIKGDKSDSSSTNTAARRLEHEFEDKELEKEVPSLISGVKKMQISSKKSSHSRSSSKSTHVSKKSSSKSSTSNADGCTSSTSEQKKSNDPDYDNSAGGEAQQRQGTNVKPAQTTTNNNNNNNNKTGNSNTKKEGDGKERRKAILAQFTQVNAKIGFSGNYYRIRGRITDMVHFVDQKNFTYVAKFKFVDRLNFEEEILSQLSDKFIKPVDSFNIIDELRCLILPYEQPVPWKTEREFRTSAYQVLCAIAELHERNIMHGDIKYANVIRGYDRTYLIDLDLALQHPETYTTKYHGTFGYRAPESIKNGTLSLKMDIYSYGIYLYELLHNQKISRILGVREEDEEDQVVMKLKEAIKRLLIESKRSPKLFNLITRCMTEDPELRPTAKELMMDPFFDRIRPKNMRDDENTEPVRSPTKVPRSPLKNKIASSPLRDITNTHS